MMVNIAKAVDVDLLIWSGLEAPRKASGGKYTKANHLESKAAVTDYARKSGIPFVNVQAGCYASNFTAFFKFEKQVDESYVLGLPFNQSTVTPIIDMVEDYGMFVRKAIESPAFGGGTEILTCGEL